MFLQVPEHETFGKQAGRRGQKRVINDDLHSRELHRSCTFPAMMAHATSTDHNPAFKYDQVVVGVCAMNRKVYVNSILTCLHVYTCRLYDFMYKLVYH